jgi:hypothetical protein
MLRETLIYSATPACTADLTYFFVKNARNTVECHALTVDRHAAEPLRSSIGRCDGAKSCTSATAGIAVIFASKSTKSISAFEHCFFNQRFLSQFRSGHLV